ncbi:hypothetical protein HS088_TW09G00186 [Tripterygium wilfordii]|uniref:Plant/T7A14-6 protein n=1 Tax=Tripterygium wilfordii TaxID=458696 RepID=A0A7J7D753_TRIWF|nr:uncharacterized protein LOC120005695 [Tripterygium wilfordii]KAF5742144.1 hypothetical protein HS088_TW09G00186 [Tripterygium wilfordii]
MMSNNKKKKSRGQQQRVFKVVIGTIGICIAGYIMGLGPTLYWHLSDLFTSSVSVHCPPCLCDCSTQPLLSLFDDDNALNNISFTDCMKRDPEVSDEMERRSIHMLSEELRQKEAEAEKIQQRADRALLEAKKMTSQYQKEADKCNSGMETCEEARERAEEALAAQKNITAMWMIRAHLKGWNGTIYGANADQIQEPLD